MPAPDLSTRQIALSFKDLVHYVFGASGTVFINNFLSISIFYPALHQQGFPKFMQAGDLSNLEISTHMTRELLLSILERYRPRKQFFLRSGHLYFYTIQSLTTVYFSMLSNNLSNWRHEQFFARQHYTKRIQSSADGTSSLMTSSLTFAHFVSVLSHFGAHSRSRLVASPTSPQSYKHILALKEFSQTTCICLFRKKAFQFELLFYCLLFANLLLWILTCLTWAQPSHTHKNWTNREICTAYQKWSRISLWLWQISERAFVH